MSKLPFDTVRVGPYIYSIAHMDRHDEAVNSDNVGFTMKDDLFIKIHSGLEKTIEADTVLHEILHCIYHVYNIKDEDIEEDTVRMVSTGLCILMRDNPKLMSWIQKQLGGS
jgi:hypothetical protein